MRILPTVTLLVLVAIWSIPTIGLMITSFRPQDAAMQTGWWDAIFNPQSQEDTLKAFATVIERDSMFESVINT
ncbi:MAG: carbohydrate ABC transporter permease, partial [Aquiluna sp.]